MLWLLVISLSLTQGILATKSCSHQELELGIVLDSSVSIEDKDFLKGIKFLQDYLQEFDIGPKNVRVAIIPYAQGVYTDVSFNLNTYSTKEDVISAIGRISHKQGQSTDTGEGIKYMREVQMSDAVVRPGVTKIGLVITDGNSQKKNFTAAEAGAARASGIIMFAVGVGVNVSREELLNIAGDTSRVSKADNYDKLNSIIKSLFKKTCDKIEQTSVPPDYPRDDPNVCTSKNPLDIYFVFSTSDMGIGKTIWTNEFILATVSTQYGNSLFKYGFIADLCLGDSGFKLESYNSDKDIKARLKPYETRKLYALLQQLIDSGYTAKQGARPNAKKVVVLVVDGAKSAELVSKQVKTLVDKGISVFIADPTNSGIKIKGTTTLVGESLAQSTELVQYLCKPCLSNKSN
ncbi:cartilage matrix protein-like [Biomphalaria glabrata]|uniref:Cartilage matrix protein-like n=1 Tax=Biomphalaria glabrata TaxID=6526 RepID=A0A9W2YKK3_BIOGL|nr:cartilage matrix protein-like [Biomphalaria glabrata]